MKNTDINNPDIIVKDERLLELDAIVGEVRESEEWEAVRMDLIDIGINRGIIQGISQGELKKLIAQVSKKKAKNCSVLETADMLETECSLVQKIYDALDSYDPQTQWKEIIKAIQ
jgi:vacuolar-type H+-ATPase catalytic subunit A/Vma1